MNTPEFHAIQENMKKIQRELAEIKRQQQSLVFLVIVIATLFIFPLAFPFVLAAYIFWQIVDALHRRKLRKRLEQRVFQQLSGRI